MSKKHAPLAIAYDFDGTLARGNMQENSFIPEVGETKEKFWKKVKKLAKQHDGDEILMYMGRMLDFAAGETEGESAVRVDKETFEKRGLNLPLFDGVEEWFPRINKYGKKKGVNVEHYIISSGIREMIKGTKIGRQFKAIYASSFWYDQHDVAKRPALAVNYTTKTQFLFRINKGILNAYDRSEINKFVSQDERPVPFSNIVFIGDGETDVPCFSLVKQQGGHAVAVYTPGSRAKDSSKSAAEQLVRDGRVSYVAPANYTGGKTLDEIVKAIIDKVSTDANLKQLVAKVEVSK